MSKVFDSLVESAYDFEPDRFMRENQGKLELSEKAVLDKKEKTIMKKALKPGRYNFFITCDNGKFLFKFQVKDRINNSILDISKVLEKGADYEAKFVVNKKDEPGVFELFLKEKAFVWKRSKYEFSLMCYELSGKKKPKKMVTVRVNGGSLIKYLKVTTHVKYEVLVKKLVEIFGYGRVIKYKDRYNDIIPIDKQECLEIFFQEFYDREHLKMYYLKPGQTVKMLFPTQGNGEVQEEIVTDTVSSSPLSVNFPSIGSPCVEDEEIQEEQWQLGGVIGKGGFATVYLGLNMVNSRLMAVKEINISKNVSKSQLKDLHNEIALMKKLKHENIVRYLGMEKKGENLYIFVDYIPGGSLESILEKFSFNESLIQTHVLQILTGLDYLHSNDVIHRDIKCANLLLDENGKVYLADFGCSKQLASGMTNEKKTLFGTPNFMSPEIIESNLYTSKGDVWALGCTIIEMITRKPPWYNIMVEFNDPLQFLFHMRKNLRNLKIPIPKGISAKFKDFLKHCLEKDHKKRYSVKQLLGHPWLQRKIQPMNINEKKGMNPLKLGVEKKEKKDDVSDEEPDNNDSVDGDDDGDDDGDETEGSYDDLADISTYDSDNKDDLLPEEKEELKKLEENEFSEKTESEENSVLVYSLPKSVHINKVKIEDRNKFRNSDSNIMDHQIDKMSRHRRKSFDHKQIMKTKTKMEEEEKKSYEKKPKKIKYNTVAKEEDIDPNILKRFETIACSSIDVLGKKKKQKTKKIGHDEFLKFSAEMVKLNKKKNFETMKVLLSKKKEK